MVAGFRAGNNSDQRIVVAAQSVAADRTRVLSLAPDDTYCLFDNQSATKHRDPEHANGTCGSTVRVFN